MGATYDEVVADYMTTYVNYYHLEEGGEQYEAVKNSNIVSILTNITGAAGGHGSDHCGSGRRGRGLYAGRRPDRRRGDRPEGEPG